jgi:hypothetical protein
VLADDPVAAADIVTAPWPTRSKERQSSELVSLAGYSSAAGVPATQQRTTVAEGRDARFSGRARDDYFGELEFSVQRSCL